MSVSVFPKVAVTSDVSGVYNYPALAKAADYLVIMTYNRHQGGSLPGPVAPINWVQANIRYALNHGVSAKKIVLGIANYGYDWVKGSTNGEYQSEKTLLQRANNHGATIQWDPTSKSPYYTYTDNSGQKHVVWFESGESGSYRVKLAKQYNLKGVAVWRLGFGTSNFFKKLGVTPKKASASP